MERKHSFNWFFLFSRGSFNLKWSCRGLSWSISHHCIGSFTRPLGANRQGRFHRTLGCLDQSRRTPRIQAETQGGRRVRDNHGIGLRWAPIQSHQPIWQELKVSAVMCQPHWAQSYNEDTKARSGVPASLVFTTVTHGHSNCTFENISWKPFRKELHRWRGRWGVDRDGEYM